MKYWKQSSFWFRSGVLVFVWALFPVISGEAETLDRIIAKVNENIITQSELEERAFVKMMNLQKINAQPMPSKLQVMNEELDLMIEERLLIDSGQKLGMKVEEENVTKAIDEIKRTNGISDGDLERMLQAESKTLDDYKSKIREQILVSRVVGFEVRKRVTVSQEEIEKYYSEHLKDYWVSEKLKLRHILFLMDDTLFEADKRVKREKAQLALKKIRAGEDFIAVAKELSEDISASTGGDLGEIERGKMVAEFEKAAFLLKEGEVSDLVETPYGLHIIKVDKVIPGQTRPLDEVMIEIKNQIMDEKMKVEYREYVSELRRKAFIENKLSTSSQARVENSADTTPVKNLSPAPGREELVADIPSPTGNISQNEEVGQEQAFSRFHSFEEKLRYYKQLRSSNEISEGEYQNKKRELLNHF